MTDLLTGYTILITGANRGIGRAMATLFAQHGATLFLNGRQKAPLITLATELQSRHAIEAHALPFDVSDPQAVKQGFRGLLAQTQSLDVLVNNAGILQDALLGMVTTDQLDALFHTNTHSVIYCAQYAARLMQRQQAGSIINIASIIGQTGNAGQAAYSGSKAAVIGITRSLAKELAEQNIRVNAIAPGFIDTDMAHSLSTEQFEARVASIAMGRIGSPAEVAKTALFLASDLASYVTGQVIGVDGGMLI